MVGPDNFRCDVIDFHDVKLVDVLTQNSIIVDDSFTRSSKSMELVGFLSHVVDHGDEIISLNK